MKRIKLSTAVHTTSMQMIDIVQNRKWKAAKRIILHDYKMAQYRKGATAMILNEKERAAIMDLQTQEKSCVEKYGKYAEQARDPELKNLFRNIQQEEQKHYESLSMILSGSVPECNCNDRSGRDYQPKAVYAAMSSPEDKQHDAFLATDCIGTEKLVSGTYNDDVFAFGDSGVRKLLADIQIEEQNHAEMLYKYKTVNGML